ncbi:hypothetical protein, partial [Variovorax sp. KK3]|uniref:hypothetical protein n=1 Tax=Variovorax sp. KK3 TaxID=1855728 RepID=UPI001180A202
MTAFTTNDPIFVRIRDTEGVNPVALQNFVNGLNQNSFANAQVTAMVARGDAVFELLPHAELVKRGAAAMYDSDRNAAIVGRDGKLAVQLDA